MFLNNLELKLLILVVLLFSSPYLAETQESVSDCDILAAVQQDNSWFINCSFSELGQDTINIYETKNDGILDFVNEIWIFDSYSDGRANLIISFVKNDEGLFAFLYDDQDRNGEVDYEIVDNILLIQEGSYPTITVKARDAWWERDGIVNYNLEISIDGLVRGMFFGGSYQNGIWIANVAPNTWAEVRTDGNAEFLTKVYDTDVDGHPNYFIIELQMEEFSRSSAVHRLEMAVNVYDNEDAPLDNAILWPYLASSHGFVQDYNTNSAPIQIDWEHSILTDVGEFVASRGGENNYFIYSTALLDNLSQDGAYIGNFENPFAFYDLAQDADGVPELQIRNQYAHPQDAYFISGIYTGAMNNIRYSWDQNNDGFWDYKVDLAGNSEITTNLSFNNLNILSIPYNDFPNWAIGNNWGAISFVSTEDLNYVSSEGIYEGAISTDVQQNYLTGFSDTYEVALSSIYLGMRVDYNIEALSQPFLYLNSIDHQLHLLGAKSGIWFIADNPVRYLLYEDVNSDGYFDHWQLFVDNGLELAPSTINDISRYGNALSIQDLLSTESVLLEELIWSDNKLIYYDAQSSALAIKSIHVEPSLFETLPPRTHQEWLDLSESLYPYKESRLTEGNLANLFAQFDTPFLLQGRGVTVSELRAMPSGLRFLLNVANNAEISGDLVHKPIRAGSHIIELSDTMQVYPATIPNIELSGTRYEATALTVFEPINVVWELHNSSRRDALEMPVQVRLISPNQQMTVLTDTTIRLLAEADLSFSQLWYPQNVGDWTLELVIGADTFPIEFSIAPSETNFTPQEVFSLFGDIAWGGSPIFLMLFAIGLIPALLIFIILMQGDKA